MKYAFVTIAASLALVACGADEAPVNDEPNTEIVKDDECPRADGNPCKS